MSPGRRILINVLATYGRSLYALILGLFTARWTLEALGSTDYGLLGLIGGLAAFVSFLNKILANSVVRFYAVSVGAAKRSGNEINGLETCRAWFNTACSIHMLIPLALVAIGYPIGIWAIDSFLTIPNDRIADSVWVWRFTCLSCFVGMFNVPFTAMYTAKQEIAELTIYSFITSTCNACFVCYMVNHPGVWLARYSLWTCMIAIVPQIIIAVRAMIKYPECHFSRRLWFSFDRCKQLARFAFSRFWADFSGLLSSQGQSILVNKFMGPIYNASMTLGNSISAHTSTLSAALIGAFTPAVGNMCGERRTESMKRLCYMACRHGCVLLLVFALPVVLEIDEILKLWLINPPPFAAEIATAILVRAALEKMTSGYPMAIYSQGERVMTYGWSVGWSGVSGVIISSLFFLCGLGMWSVAIGLVTSKFITVGIRLFYGKTLIGFEPRDWIYKVFIPISTTVIASGGFASLLRLFAEPSLLRVVITVFIADIIFISLVWFFVLEGCERSRILAYIERLRHFSFMRAEDKKL